MRESAGPTGSGVPRPPRPAPLPDDRARIHRPGGVAQRDHPATAQRPRRGAPTRGRRVTPRHVACAAVTERLDPRETTAFGARADRAPSAHRIARESAALARRLPVMTTATPDTLRALLLDRDPAVVAAVGDALARRGLASSAALDGVTGVERLLDELLALDVLVLDLGLPGRDGWSLLRLVRSAGGEQELGVVVLVDHPDAAVRDQLLALGADAVIPRAASPSAAARAIARVARIAAMRRRRATLAAAARWTSAAVGALRVLSPATARAPALRLAVAP